jgi:Protein of unknown function (DUF2752)
MEEDRNPATSGMMTRPIQVGMWAGGFSAGLAVVYNFPPAEHSFYPRCPFYAATHWLCPGCGGTRAFYELLHVNLRGALHYNALVTLLAPFALMWFAWSCYRFLRDNRFPPVPWPRTIAACLGIVSLLFAVARNTGIAFVI